MTGPQITIARKSGAAALSKRLLGLGRLAAYVGIPSDGTVRTSQLIAMAGKTNSKKKRAKLIKAAEGDVSNAEILFIQSKGSPARGIPARPVLEPSVMADGNRQAIGHELAGSVKAALAGDKPAAEAKMMRAALAGQNAARGWFTDPRNGWPPNAPGTIAAKGSDRPLIDTGALRVSIIGLVRED
jgi:hypothetical protein